MERITYHCQQCAQDLSATIDICPSCGKKGRMIALFVEEQIGVDESIKGEVKNKNSGSKKRKYIILEFFNGADYSIKKKKMMKKIRVINRIKNYYYEKVEDPDTGEIVRFCEQPLDKHRGHGSDYNNKRPISK